MTRVSKPTTRERIADAAANVFYERGIHRTTVDDAVARSGFSKPTLYKHFESKDELIQAGLEVRDRRHRERLNKLWETPGQSPVESLLVPFDLVEIWFEERVGYRGCAFVTAAVELPQDSHPGRSVVLEHKRWLRSRLEEFAVEAGASDPPALAAGLLYLLEGAMVMAGVDRAVLSASPPKTAAAALIEAYSGVGGEPSP